jgi:hypothetical protein
VTHLYRIYGLTLQSDLKIPSLCPLVAADAVNRSPDLVLELSSKPAWATAALKLPPHSVRTRPTSSEDSGFSVTEFAGAEFVLLSYGDGTRILLDREVAKLWGEPGPGLTLDDLLVYLLGPVMGYILRKRGFSPLHASAVTIRGKAVAIVGEAGAGKSTTAAALGLRGWPVLCEDVCALQAGAGRFEVVPAYPRILLWPDSVEFLYQRKEALPLVVDGWEKRFLPLDGSQASFATQCVPLGAIFLLAPRSRALTAPSIEQVSAKDAFLALVQDTYMNWLLDSGERAAEFDLLIRLVSCVPCFKVTPSIDPGRLGALVELIEKHALRADEAVHSQTTGQSDSFHV